MGTLSGEAIKRALIIGYIKRLKNLEIYDILVDREVKVIISVLKCLHPDKTKLLDELVVSFEFQEPFEEDRQTRWSSIGSAYSIGIISLNTAVRLLGITDKPDEEVEKILREAAEKKKISEKEHQPTS